MRGQLQHLILGTTQLSSALEHALYGFDSNFLSLQVAASFFCGLEAPHLYFLVLKIQFRACFFVPTSDFHYFRMKLLY